MNPNGQIIIVDNSGYVYFEKSYGTLNPVVYNVGIPTWLVSSR